MGSHPYVVTGLRWLLWTLLALVAFVLACNVVNRWGQAYALLFPAAAWVATDQCRRIVGLFANAVRRHMKEEAAAISMGVTKSQYSEGVNCVKQISMSRAADVGEDVWLDFAVDLVQQSGRYVVIEKGVLSDLVFAVLAQNESLKVIEAETKPRPFVRMERAS